MKWAYGIENDINIKRNNTPLFLAIRSFGIPDDYIIMEKEEHTERPKLQELIVNIQKGDFLIIRSLEDLADSFEELLSALNLLTEKRIILSSCKEVFLSEYDYYSEVKGLWELSQYFYEQKRLMAYRNAVKAGRVGRPSSGNAQKCIDLYKQGALSKEEVIEMARISEPTFYRYLKNSKGDEENADIERNDESGV